MCLFEGSGEMSLLVSCSQQRSMDAGEGRLEVTSWHSECIWEGEHTGVQRMVSGVRPSECKSRLHHHQLCFPESLGKEPSLNFTFKTTVVLLLRKLFLELSKETTWQKYWHTVSPWQGWAAGITQVFTHYTGFISHIHLLWNEDAERCRKRLQISKVRGNPIKKF